MRTKAWVRKSRHHWAACLTAAAPGARPRGWPCQPDAAPWPAASRLPFSGVMPSARNAGIARPSTSAPAGEPAPSAVPPHDPRHRHSRRSASARAGSARAAHQGGQRRDWSDWEGSVLRAKSGGHQVALQEAKAPKDTQRMTFQITVQPSGRTFTAKPTKPSCRPASARALACPMAARTAPAAPASARRSKVSWCHGPHQGKALSPEEEAAGYVLTCCAVPQSDVVLESRQVTEANAFPIKKMPARVASRWNASRTT
jgi:hypothetical protein